MRRLHATLMVLVLLVSATASASLAQPQPEFRLGFKTLAEHIPEIVRQPIEEEHYGANGDSLQQTTSGLMVWRKADNWTAFTNGSRSWVNGPFGVQDRDNGARFPWEAPAPPTAVPVATPPPLPFPAATLIPASPTASPTPALRHSPDVRAMDQESAGPGITVKQWMQETSSEWERVWGWRPGKPTTIYLYFDGLRMAEGLSPVIGEALTTGEKRYIAQGVHALATEDKQTGGWAVLLNLGRDYGEAHWQVATRSVLIHEYTHVMQMDTAGRGGPTWFMEGMAQLCAFTTVPQALADTNRLAITSHLSCANELPSLRSLNDTWPSMVGEDPQLAYGMSYFAMKHLAERVGGSPLLEVLRRTAAGEGFEQTLQGVTGYTLDRLDAEYRRTPCGAYR